jgi:hypothetical protein
MSLSDLASLGSFVSGVAVLASLVFLFFQMRQMNEQVRQTEKNQQALIKQGRTDRSAMGNTNLATSPLFFEAQIRVMTCADDLTPVDCMRAAAMTLANFQAAEEAFSQHRRGVLDEQDFNGALVSLRRLLQLPFHRYAWKRSREAFTGEFVDFIDKVIAETPVVDAFEPSRLVAEWRAGISAERAKA